MSTTYILRICTIVGLMVTPNAVWAQTPQGETRTDLIEETQAQKISTLHPYLPTKGEQIVTRIQNALLLPKNTKVYPFFQNAYRGGGFAAGLGYTQHVSSYSTIDIRGSYSIRSYKRAELEFVSPRLFNDRAKLSLLGGWREATEVGFWGVGPDTTSDTRVTYGFRQPHGSALFTVRPTRRFLVVDGGFELSKWNVYPKEVPSLTGSATYLHTQAALAFDWRSASGYARRGGIYKVTAHDYSDRDDRIGFNQIDYEVIQHFPILRESWVISLRGFAETTQNKQGQDVPFFLMPSLGGGSNLRGFSSWRFRDRNSLLVQGEWRVMVNRFFDTAVFYDTGKVAPSVSKFSLDNLQHDYGFGVRFHTPFSTPLRIDIARSNEGTSLVFSTSQVF